MIGQVLTQRALQGRLPHLGRAVDAGLRSLAGRGRFDPVAVAEEACLRAALPVHLADAPPGLVPALLASAKAGRALVEAAVHIPRWWPSSMRRRIRAAHCRLRAELGALLTTDGPPPSDHPTLLDLLRADSVPTDLSVKVMANALLSGIPAMSGAWCWLLHHLATHPDHLARIRAEALAHGLTGKLPFTTAFVRETLRTHPPAWLLGRDSTTAIAITDRSTVPAGTAIMFSPYLIHHDPRHWPDPDRFDPDRWFSPNPVRHRHTYLPFGAGPRVCLGLHLGQILLTLTAAHIAVRYRLAVATPTAGFAVGPFAARWAHPHPHGQCEPRLISTGRSPTQPNPALMFVPRGRTRTRSPTGT